MAKKKESKKKRASSVSSEDSASDRRGKTLSKFQEFVPAAGDALAASSLTPPAPPSTDPDNFVPVLPTTILSAATGIPISIQPAAATSVAPLVADDLVPVHLVQAMPAQSTVNITVGGLTVSSVGMEATGGIIREPDPPKTIVRVTKEGCPPPSMRMELLALL